MSRCVARCPLLLQDMEDKRATSAHQGRTPKAGPAMPARAAAPGKQAPRAPQAVPTVTACLVRVPTARPAPKASGPTWAPVRPALLVTPVTWGPSHRMTAVSAVMVDGVQQWCLLCYYVCMQTQCIASLLAPVTECHFQPTPCQHLTLCMLVYAAGHLSVVPYRCVHCCRLHAWHIRAGLQHLPCWLLVSRRQGSLHPRMWDQPLLQCRGDGCQRVFLRRRCGVQVHGTLHTACKGD